MSTKNKAQNSVIQLVHKFREIISKLGIIFSIILFLIGVLICGLLIWFLIPLDTDNIYWTLPTILILFAVLLSTSLIVGVAFKSSGLIIEWATKVTIKMMGLDSSNPYIAGLPVTTPDMFFGRVQILRGIISGLHNNSVVVTGPRRIGKTSLLFQLKNLLTALNDPDYLFIPIFVDVQGTPEATFFHAVMEHIVNVMPEYLPVKAIPNLDFALMNANYTDSAFGRDLSRLMKALQQSQPKKDIKLTLLMDEMDVMNSYDQRVQSQLRSIFIRFTKNLRAVVAGVNLDQ